jgi:hypothetical protein
MAGYGDMMEGPESHSDSEYGRYQKPSYEQRYNPTHMPKPEHVINGFPCKDYCCMGATPGGTENRVMWDEKAGLDNIVYRQAQTPPGESLQSAHDSKRQGIYASTSVGDYD